MTKMNPEVKTLLVDALRSGKYAQASGFLQVIKESPSSPVGFCCLGVLCEVAIEQGLEVKVEPSLNKDLVTYDDNSAYLPSILRGWAGLSDCGDMDKGQRYDWTAPDGEEHTFSSLIEANDAGMPFEAIADMIEEVF